MPRDPVEGRGLLHLVLVLEVGARAQFPHYELADATRDGLHNLQEGHTEKILHDVSHFTRAEILYLELVLEMVENGFPTPPVVLNLLEISGRILILGDKGCHQDSHLTIRLADLDQAHGNFPGQVVRLHEIPLAVRDRDRGDRIRGGPSYEVVHRLESVRGRAADHKVTREGREGRNDGKVRVGPVVDADHVAIQIPGVTVEMLTLVVSPAQRYQPCQVTTRSSWGKWS